MFHHVIRLAESHDIPVQVIPAHSLGPAASSPNSNPTHLLNTFLLYPRVRFDIFHLSFPYQQELGA